MPTQPTSSATRSMPTRSMPTRSMPTRAEREALTNLWRTGRTGRHTSPATRRGLVDAGWVERFRGGFLLTKAGHNAVRDGKWRP